MQPSQKSLFGRVLAVRRSGRLLAVAGLLIFWTACSRSVTERQPAKNANVPSAAPVRFLGSVHVIGTGGRFVLVEATVVTAAAGLVDGQFLVCRTAGADSAILRVSHERRPPFVVADVTSGEPHVGDEVFVEPAPGPSAKPTPPGAVPTAP